MLKAYLQDFSKQNKIFLKLLEHDYPYICTDEDMFLLIFTLPSPINVFLMHTITVQDVVVFLSNCFMKITIFIEQNQSLGIN